MNNIVKKPLKQLGYNFIDEKYLPQGKDEYYLRDQQWGDTAKYRNLSASEIETLIRNNNTSDNWQNIFVCDQFDPNLVKRCNFFGKVRIGALEPFLLEYHSIQLQVGLYDSTIVSCDFGDNVVVRNVTHMAHYQLGDESILYDIAELITTSHAKFGNGILKEGENPSSRIWVEVCNENTGRKILPFDGMLAGDAYLWSKYRGDHALMDKFVEFTEQDFSKARGCYGTIGDRTIIKNCKIIKDVKVGDDAYIKGANKLKNLTIRSSADAGTQIGEGVELVNGIVGFGCRVFYGVKAVRFVLGSHSSLKYGARLINSYLGNNATISCCEVLNSLIFPGHEQHHNNSFLCAALVQGQSNIAAGATLGSNHNSRGNDGEIIAGRGFWPGLCVSLKHNCRFASYTLIAKGDYPAEINLPLPFALLSQNNADDELSIMPNYWFMYNMYALARNTWKYGQRDKRHLKIQTLDFDYLAPDTIQEVVHALDLLKLWAGKALHPELHKDEIEKLMAHGEDILENRADSLPKRGVEAWGIENTKRKVRILKAKQAYDWYRDLIKIYFVENLLDQIEAYPSKKLHDLIDQLVARPDDKWENIGGQMMRRKDVERIKKRIKSGEIASWGELHLCYQTLGELYPNDKLIHAYSTYLEVFGEQDLQSERLKELLTSFLEVKQKMNLGVFKSREKDYKNAYRNMVYDSVEEMESVVGKLSENEFIEVSKQDLLAHKIRVEKVINSL